MRVVAYRIKSCKIDVLPVERVGSVRICPEIDCSVDVGKSRVRVTFSVRIKKDGAEPIPFELSATGEGLVEIESGDSAKVHVRAAELIYPLFSASVTSLVSLTKLPDYFLPFIDIEKILEKSVAVKGGEQPS